jgi:CNH domain
MTNTILRVVSPLSRHKPPRQDRALSDPAPVASLSPSAPDSKLLYPFSITHLGASGDTYLLHAESANSRQTWVDRIIEAKTEHAAALFETEPFEANIIGESVFGNSVPPEGLPMKPPPLIVGSTMSRALTRKDGRISLGGTMTHARVNSAKSFIAPVGTDFAHHTLVAVGTDDGVYISSFTEGSGQSASWVRVLNTPKTTQIDVMEEHNVFLVLTNRELIAYSLKDTIPERSAGPGNDMASVQRQQQKLSGNSSVAFFATGKLNDRTVVIYKNPHGSNSEFKIMEPIVGNTNVNRTNAKGEFFRDLDVLPHPIKLIIGIFYSGRVFRTIYISEDCGNSHTTRYVFFVE